jgi:3-(3-hydroxy-phenyl)propionate hydroxylase
VPGHARYRRWEFQLQPGETREEMSADDTVWKLLSSWITPDDARLVRSVVYRFHATVAASMRAGRVFLAGDAAHQMPPFLGQGLCAGVRDAANLSWKLELVAAGRAGDRLLDSYDAERRPHAAGVVAHAVDTGRLIDSLAGRPVEGVGLESAYGGQRPFPHLTSGLLAGDHPFTGRQFVQPRIDGRGFDERLGSGFAIVTAAATRLPEAALARWSALGATVVEYADLPPDIVPVDGAAIVRPDRYVAAITASPDAFITHTEQLFEQMS